MSEDYMNMLNRIRSLLDKSYNFTLHGRFSLDKQVTVITQFITIIHSKKQMYEINNK